MERGFNAKVAIANVIVDGLPENSALALTAGSTPYAVAREIRHRVLNDLAPHNLIVFTNSLPALLELASVNISTGILGEIYAPDDCAFHTPEFHSAFQPSIAIVGASGVLLGDTLDLFSHRAEEAAFLKRLLKDIPEIVLAVDHTKLGRRHPWSFGGATLWGKSVRLVTDTLSDAQCDALERLRNRLLEQEVTFRYEIASPLS
jgi:DeoR/GlpR family transcriptional regulator of sugar metabolism